MRLLFIASLLLVCTLAEDKSPAPDPEKKAEAGPAAKAAPAAPAASSDSKGSTEKSEKKKEEDQEKKDSKKMKVGGLYTTDKVANVKNMKGNHPVSIIK